MTDKCCKVQQSIDSRGLSISSSVGDMNDYLAARWTGEGKYPEAGVRTLVEWFNKKILKEVYNRSGRTTTEIRIDSEYSALMSDDEIERAEIISDLARDGIDGEQLIQDFVSKSTMARHLKNCLGITKNSPNTTPNSDWERDKITYAKNVVNDDVEDAVRSLDNKDRLPGGAEAEIDISIVLRCPKCPTRVRFEDALDRGYICKSHLGESSISLSTGDATDSQQVAVDVDSDPQSRED
jgi:hypothetical protein